MAASEMQSHASAPCDSSSAKDSMVEAEEAAIGGLPAPPDRKFQSSYGVGIVCLLITAIGWGLS